MEIVHQSDLTPASDDTRVDALQARVVELETTLRHRERQIQAMRRTGEALFAHHSVDAMVRETLHTALEVLCAEAGSLQLYDADNDTLNFRYVVGPASETLTGYVMPASQGISGKVFRSGVPDLTQHVGERADFNRAVDAVSGYHTDSMMTVPVKRPEGNAIGVMQILNAREPRFDHRDLEVLQVLCGQAASVIETARLAQAARKAELVNIIGDLSHDIKNMLTPIQSGMWTLEPMLETLFLDLDEVIRQNPESDTSKQIRHIVSLLREDYIWIFEGAHEACKQVEARTREIADAVKGQSKAPVFEKSDLNETALSVARPLSMVAERNAVQLVLDLDQSLPHAEFDRSQIYNALYNLVNNAIPETPAGGTVTLRTRAPQSDHSQSDQPQSDEPQADSTVNSSTRNSYLTIEIADTGRGIPEHIRTRLFTDEAISSKPGGNGLGTRIVADVVRRHNGTIEVQSEENKGSIFTIRLPLQHTF